MKLLITGDLAITKQYPKKNIDKNLINLFQNSDYNIVNLEAPVTESDSKIIKTGPHLKSDTGSTLEVLKALNVNLCTLANNHILDYGEKGVLDTLQFCEGIKISTVGAGKNKEEASKVFYIGSPEGKIAIINIAENEWASATETSAGANGMDLIDDMKSIQNARVKSDFVLVIVHGGLEYYNLPSPAIQKKYRFYIENGADLVLGHHTHCISGKEVYKGKSIYYSVGNFLFTKNSNYSDWYNGFILELNISSGELKTKCHPIQQNETDFRLSFLEGDEKGNFFKRVKEYNEIIQDPTRLSDAWCSLIDKKSMLYISLWSPFVFIRSRYLRALFIKLGIRFINKRGLSYYLNLMRCETHSDISMSVLNNKIKK